MSLCRCSCDCWVLMSFGGGSSDKYDEQRRVWGGGLRGNKSTQMLRKRTRAAGQSTTAASLGKL